MLHKMSTELPWSMRTFFTAKFSTSTIMTMGSSWLRSVPWKSEYENVIGDILLCELPNIACTDWAALRFFFPKEDDLPPPTNPSEIVFIVRHRGGLSSGLWQRWCPWFSILCSCRLSSWFPTFDSSINSSLKSSVITFIVSGSG